MDDAEVKVLLSQIVEGQHLILLQLAVLGGKLDQLIAYKLAKKNKGGG